MTGTMVMGLLLVAAPSVPAPDEGTGPLAGTAVRIVAKDRPLAEVVADLARQSGGIRLDGPPAQWAGRTVTLDTGKVSFWEALDRLCREARLREKPAPPRALPFAHLEVARTKYLSYPAHDTFDQPGTATPIVLTAGPPAATATFRRGGLRIRALAAGTTVAGAPAPTGRQIAVPLAVDLEPGLGWGGVVGVSVRGAADDQGQTLRPADVAMPTHVERVFNVPREVSLGGAINPLDQGKKMVYLDRGEKAAGALRELTGTLRGRVVTAPQVVARVADLAKAKGQTVAGLAGVKLKVGEPQAGDAGSVSYSVEISHDPATIRIVAAAPDSVGPLSPALRKSEFVQKHLAKEGALQPSRAGLTLVTATGKPYPNAVITAVRNNRREGKTTIYPVRVIFLAPGKDSPPATLLFTARHAVEVSVPFTLKDVPLR